MTRIYLVRHAEAEGNIYRRAHGHFNGQIIGRGYLQIEQLRKRFADEKPDAVYSSDLARACTTAIPVCESHGLTLNVTGQLREVCMGSWEDEAWGDLEYSDPEMSGYFSNDPARWRVSGGETYDRVRERMMDCISGIARRHDGETVMAFSHGFAIRTFLCGVLGVKSEDVAKVPYCDNTAVALLTYDKGTPAIEYQGDNTHLSSEISTFAHQTWWRAQDEWVSENLRYAKYDEARDFELSESAKREKILSSGCDEKITAYLANEPVGAIGLDTSAGLIKYIFVRPEYRRKNYGVQLLGHAMSFFRKLGSDTLRVDTAGNTDAPVFLRKYGFESTGTGEKACLFERSLSAKAENAYPKRSVII